MNHSELAHKWAHAAPGASRRCGSMSFVGDTLYSYATPIARIYRNKRGAMALLSDHSYSMSTSKHISHALRAVSHLSALRVPRYILGSHGEGRYRYSVNAAQDHAANLEYFANNAQQALASAQRAQQARNVEWRREAAERALECWQIYAAYFGIRRKAPALPAAEWAAALERARRIENPDPASADKRERERAKRAAAANAVTEYREAMRDSMQAAGHYVYRGALRNTARWQRALENSMRRGTRADFYSDAAARSDWRLFGAFSELAVRYGPQGPCMLRVNGEDIETSQGARVPLAAAPMVWNLVRQAVKCQGWTRDNRFSSRYRIGDYPLDRIDEDGTLHAGCHTIPYSELASMARALGLAS